MTSLGGSFFFLCVTKLCCCTYRHSSHGIASLVHIGSSKALMERSGTITFLKTFVLQPRLQYVSTVQRKQNDMIVKIIELRRKQNANHNYLTLGDVAKCRIVKVPNVTSLQITQGNYYILSRHLYHVKLINYLNQCHAETTNYILPVSDTKTNIMQFFELHFSVRQSNLNEIVGKVYIPSQCLPSL